MRVSAGGGVPQTIVDGKPFNRVDCVGAVGGNVECVAGYIEKHEYVFHGSDPDEKGSQELLRILHRAPFTNWALSPDGKEIAVVHNDDNTIRVFSIASGEESNIEVEGWTNFEYVEWSADGRRLYLNAGFAAVGQYPSLLVVDLEGNAKMLRQRPFEWHVHQAASPDGNYLAFVSMPFHGNAWMIKDF
jgi:DNA-binding beta-propeller fold protein YncE